MRRLNDLAMILLFIAVPVWFFGGMYAMRLENHFQNYRNPDRRIDRDVPYHWKGAIVYLTRRDYGIEQDIGYARTAAFLVGAPSFVFLIWLKRRAR